MRDLNPRLGDAQRSLADQARDYIREQVTSGVYPPGTRVKERELSEELGMSRIPIREALSGLAREGFITLQPRRGAVVAELVPDDLREIFEIREVLEVHEVTLAIRHSTPQEQALLNQVVDQERRALADGDIATVRELGSRFHEVLVEMSHNALLARMLGQLRSRMNWLFRQNDAAETICAEHAAIAEAISAGDAERATTLASEHIATSRRLAMRVLFGTEEVPQPHTENGRGQGVERS